jgi:ABC-type multidrug transport system ATPase subunit
MIALQHVSVRLAGRIILYDVTLEVRDGEVVALVGENGCGKTTLLRTIATELRPAAGTIVVDGCDVVRSAARARARIGLVPHQPGLYPSLTVREHLVLFARAYGVRRDVRRARIAALLAAAALTDRADHRVATLSAGMVQRSSVACALVHAPTALLLDEATDNMDAASRDRTHALLAELRRRRLSILMATHDADEARCLADRIVTLQRGRVAGCETAGRRERAVGE